jgi:hypothetical protein
MRVMQQFVIAFIFILIIQVNENPLAACSGGGGGYWLESFLDDETRIIAMGEVAMTTANGINSIITITHYLQMPQANGTLILKQLSMSANNLLESQRPHPARCSYFPQSLEAGTQFIASLSRSADGTYYGIIISADRNDVFSLYLGDGSQPVEPVEYTFEELTLYAESYLGRTAQPPEYFRFPRAIEIEFMTESGQAFLIPVDSTEPVAVPIFSSPDCFFLVQYDCTSSIVAPNGVDVAAFFPEDTDIESYYSADLRYAYFFEAETGVFSPDSALIAVWRDNQIRIFSTKFQTAFDGQFSEMPILIASHVIDPDDTLLIGAGAFSPNGFTFAFSTERGVWTFDLRRPQVPPTMVIQSENSPLRVLGFSPLGTYLSVQESDLNIYIDWITGQRYPDGVFSPDERLLAVYDTTAETHTPLTLYRMIPEFRPLMNWENYQPEISEFEWISPTQYVFAACGEALAYSEDPGFDEAWCKISRSTTLRGISQRWQDGTQFDFEPVTQTLGVLVDGNSIAINGSIIEIPDLGAGAITSVKLTPVIAPLFPLG